MTNAPHSSETDDDLTWDGKSVPVSVRFGDSYYSRDDGRAESDHVFVEGNSLRERWPKMDQCTIGELGFGTGLNFLQTVWCWQRLRPAGAGLRYVAFEAFPISNRSLVRAHSPWSELATISAELVSQWRTEQEMARLRFDPDIELVLFFCDAEARLPRLDFAADAWYLDGFAPSRNPQMWGTSLMQAVYGATRPGGTFATYTAAGWVRRNLQNAGFEIRRLPGFGRKREMLAGAKPG